MSNFINTRVLRNGQEEPFAFDPAHVSRVEYISTDQDLSGAPRQTCLIRFKDGGSERVLMSFQEASQLISDRREFGASSDYHTKG